jgi:integrase
MDETIVKKLVGHEQGNTTDKYYNKISMNRMREELIKFRRPVVENNN